MPPDRETRRVQLNYPADRAGEPVIYRLVVDHGIIPDIRRGSFDSRAGGVLVVELTGEKEALDRGIAWLEEIGVTVGPPGMDAARDWAV